MVKLHIEYKLIKNTFWLSFPPPYKETNPGNQSKRNNANEYVLLSTNGMKT